MPPQHVAQRGDRLVGAPSRTDRPARRTRRSSAAGSSRTSTSSTSSPAPCSSSSSLMSARISTIVSESMPISANVYSSRPVRLYSSTMYWKRSAARRAPRPPGPRTRRTRRGSAARRPANAASRGAARQLPRRRLGDRVVGHEGDRVGLDVVLGPDRAGDLRRIGQVLGAFDLREHDEARPVLAGVERDDAARADLREADSTIVSM